MAESILKLKVESSEYDSKIKRAAEGLQHYASQCRKAGGTLEFVEKDTLKFVNALGHMETSSTSARGKLNELTKAFTEMSVVYNKLTDEEKASPFGKALAESLSSLKVRIQEGRQEISDISNQLNSSSGLSGALDAVASKFGINISQLKSFGGALGLATAAAKVAKDAFFNMESGIDEWGRTVEGAKGAYSVFLDTLNNGNWSNFFQNLQTAIQGGRDLYDVFDRLGSIKANNSAAIAIVQKEIAELRLAKQQGENVDAKLKSATERLAILQRQSVTAGQNAGTMSAFQTIRNGVNSVGGAGVNDATIKYAIDRIMKNGQSEFDKYKNNYQILQNKGTRTTVIPLDDGMGGTVNKYQTTFDINLLTQEQQKQYALAKAITEGETRIQKGIAAYAQAVQEGTSAAREEFKGNRYALQGSGGSGGRGGSGGSGFNISSIAFNPISDESLKFDPKQHAVASGLRPEDFLGKPEEWKTYVEAITGGIGSVEESIDNLTNWTPEFKPFLEQQKKMTEAAKQNQMAMGLAGQAVSAFGSALAGMEDPGVRAAGLVMQSIASIALGFAQAAASPLVTGTGWGWLAFVAAGAAAMATTISTIHQLSGYEQGGVVEGKSYSGDNIPIMANAGEIVLTRAMAGNLASSMQGNNMQNMNIAGRIKGTDIILAIDRSLKLDGKQLLTWGR